MTGYDLIQGVEDVWIVWMIGSLGAIAMSYRAIRSTHWRSVRWFLSDERGASYAFPYLMTFPIYLIFVCLTIQSSMILMTKFGVIQAAHRAARTAVVWRSADPYSQQRGWELAQDKAQHAAALAVAPVASGYSEFRVLYLFYPGALSRAASASLRAYSYDWLYRRFASNTEAGNDLAKSSYVRQKYVYAAAMTTVTLSEQSNAFNAPLTAQVNYRMPITVPLTGRLLGRLHPSRRAFYRDIPATVSLPLETPESADRWLGIDYDPAFAN